jgi:hypothetical protein
VALVEMIVLSYVEVFVIVVVVLLSVLSVLLDLHFPVEAVYKMDVQAIVSPAVLAQFV